MRDASVDDGSPLVGDDSPLINDESTETFEDTSTSHLRQKGNLIRSPSKKAKVGGSPRSPMKTSFAVGKTKMRSAFKKSSGSTHKSSVSLGKPPSNVVPSFETEVHPDTIAGASLLGSTSQPLIVSSIFVLPPPSPMASIPPQPDLLSPFKQPPVASSSKIQVPTISPPDHAVQNSSTGLRPALAFPLSPHPFPIAKPLAKNMFHAYSPARPSPLSRILMLADSPAQRLSLSHSEKLTEEPGTAGGGGEGPAGGREVGGTGMSNGGISLENELGIDEDTTEENSPLRERSARVALALKNGKSTSKDTKARMKTRVKNFKKVGKSEKENENAIPGDADRISTMNADLLKMKGRISPIFGLVGTTGASTMAKKPSAHSKGGARRVPIGSADAAPIGPGWK